ncbi:uncharacterized protein LOC124123503 [Haliotis rufescens]|uniref:uncharacterized protein LOC124123503 n=1 Tax=Haliotis rufescens TaxID=6454 RepID=UPI00201E95E1|nr:uncharacterized protein LOC124123503 [Haliotis rufescens]
MDTIAGGNAIPTDGRLGAYLDIPQFSEVDTEAKLRNIIRHRLGTYINLDQSFSNLTGGSSGNLSQCDISVQEHQHELSTQRRFDGEMTSSDSARNMAGKERGRGRRPSLKESEMYTCPRRASSNNWVTPFKFSKEELSAFLPRRSFFSCHDKALKDAGYDTDPSTKKQEVKEVRQQNKRELKDVRRDSVVSERKASVISKCEEMEKLLPEIVISRSEDGQDREVRDGSRPNSPATNDGKAKHVSSKTKLARKKMEDDFNKNAHKAVTEYLRHVKENPAEYIDQIKRLEANSIETKPVEKLIKTAMIYQRGQHGQARSSLVVRASHDLTLRYTDPGQWQNANKERNQTFAIGKKESSLAKPGQDGDKESKPEIDEGKTELDKCRYKAEKWMKTVPMVQQLRARQMALEEVGEEDGEVSQWWDSLRTCNYLRRFVITDAAGHSK